MSINHLCPIDVIGEGNCFFRVVYLSIYGNQRKYDKSVSQNVRSTCYSAQHADHDPLMTFAIDLQTDGVWVNESGIVATADFLQRDIHEYFASDACSPLVHAPARHTAQYDQPILIAFYEPLATIVVLSDKMTFRKFIHCCVQSVT